MRQFVDHDEFDEPWRQLEQRPVQCQGPVGIAHAPAVVEVTNGYSRIDHAEPVRPPFDVVGQPLAAVVSIPLDDVAHDALRMAATDEKLIPSGEGSVSGVVNEPQPIVTAEKRKVLSIDDLLDWVIGG